MFEDVKFYRLNDGAPQEVLSGQTIQLAMHIVCELLGEDPQDSQIITKLMSKTLTDLVGKSIDIELTIQPGSREYVETYQVKFELVKYVLTYTAGENGSITGDTEQTVEHGSDGSQIEAVPAEGYHFVKWSDGSTENPRTDTNVTAVIAVEAEFTITNYTINYELGGGENDSTNPETYTIESDTISLKAPTRAGYTFEGWFTAATGGIQVTEIAKGSTGDITLYARWEPTPITIVEQMITTLPDAGTLTLSNLGAVEEAEVAYEDLSLEEQASVASNP